MSEDKVIWKVLIICCETFYNIPICEKTQCFKLLKRKHRKIQMKKFVRYKLV